jgi:hypothetical protein
MNRNIRTLLAIVATIAALTIMTSYVIAGQTFAVPTGANYVGQVVNNNGLAPNHAHMRNCMQAQTAKSCATDPIDGNGPYTSNLAQQTNKP